MARRSIACPRLARGSSFAASRRRTGCAPAGIEPAAAQQKTPRSEERGVFLFVHHDAAKPPPIAYRATNEPAAFVRRAGAVNRSARRRRAGRRSRHGR
ncbi:hypothetical protein, partial [Burkholderia pseudomallei]|uniref:hypothetical protein n=1 Tax=Burkholderia pseudomallei TaxID=28450 RepID=UPI001C4DA43D